ncbi:hypothetical protein CTA1_6244 [Colletotrichum tanaceti]|uniref:Uncharacterized protein n=1 Tax=Colletotrichum tanaceti TaxID=1306861 RepID=A0A4U6XKC4_9PEZI|nr:hypothetical protein CTA1_6244 [Colletotrichum tanaceti]
MFGLPDASTRDRNRGMNIGPEQACELTIPRSIEMAKSEVLGGRQKKCLGSTDPSGKSTTSGSSIQCLSPWMPLLAGHG